MVGFGGLHRAHACGVASASSVHGPVIRLTLQYQRKDSYSRDSPAKYLEEGILLDLKSPNQDCMKRLVLRQANQRTCTRNLAKIEPGVGEILMFLHLEGVILISLATRCHPLKAHVQDGGSGSVSSGLATLTDTACGSTCWETGCA